MNPAFTAAYMAIAVYVYDWISNSGAEYDLLWSRRLHDLRATQYLYFAMRYSAVPFHIFNVIFQHYRKNQYSPISSQICRRWLFFTIASVGWNFALILINFMLRVYALYKLDSRVIFGLILLLSLKVANLLVTWFFHLPFQAFTPSCIPILERPLQMISFCMVELVIQSVPVYLIILRARKIEQATRAQRTVNLVAYLRREGALSWTAISISSGVVATIGVMTRHSANEILPMASYPIFVTLFSSLGCRLILLMRRSGGDVTPVSSDTAGESPELDLFDATWDIQPIDCDEIDDPGDPLISGTNRPSPSSRQEVSRTVTGL